MLSTEMILSIFVNVITITTSKCTPVLTVGRPVHIVQSPKLELVKKTEI